MKKKDIQSLKAKAYRIRKRCLGIASRAMSCHVGSWLSQTDLLVVLYSCFLNISIKNHKKDDRDRFILSKGHAGLGYYGVLAEHGLIPWSQVEKYGEDGTVLAAHPVLGSAPGIEATTGSLGHGLPMALGMAISAKRNGWKSKYVVLISDGECDEGSNWEAILLAGHLKLDNLIVIVDYNKIQSFGTTKEILDLEPFADKWIACRWSAAEVDGHDYPEIKKALDSIPFKKGSPSVIIAHTVKGKGVPSMENTLESHYYSIKPDKLSGVLKELY